MKEGRTLEFKQEITNSFLKTVSAFSNFGSGKILFGVDDKGHHVGIKDPNQKRLDIENKINESISPKPDYSISVDKKTNVITLTILEGKYKPYLYKGKAYRRSDTATIEVDNIELKRLTLEGSNLYYEQLPSENTQLDFTYLESIFIKKLDIPKLTEDILRSLGLINKDKKFNIAAELFADTNNFSGIDIVRFGKNINEILDRETLSGISILKQYDMAVSMIKRYYQYEKIEGIERKSIDLIPETAFREAIANALIHRAWDINSHIKISMFDDRIEINSPGGLPKGITEEEYINGYISNLTNPIIGYIFFRLHLIEMFGTGIKRIKASYEKTPVKPIFKTTDNTVSVTLPCTNVTYKPTSEDKKLISILEDGLALSSSEIAERLGWSKAKTIRTLNLVQLSGYIQKIGTGRSTKYTKS